MPTDSRRVTSNKWRLQCRGLGVRARTPQCYFSVWKLLGTSSKHPYRSPFLTGLKKQRRNLIFHEYHITLSICWRRAGRWAALLLTFNNWTKLYPASIRIKQGFRRCRYWDELLPAQFMSIDNLHTDNCSTGPLPCCRCRGIPLRHRGSASNCTLGHGTWSKNVWGKSEWTNESLHEW